MKIQFSFVVLLSIFIAGCASNQSSLPTVKAPSPQELDWANKALALDAQQKELQKQKQELNKQKQEIQQSQAEANLEKKQAETKAWVAGNKEQLESELTESYRTNSQNILESFGFNGVVLYYLVDDVASDGNIFSFSQVFLWKNSDDSGEIARINVEYDIQNDKFIGSNLVGTKHFSVAELAVIVNGSSEQNNQQVISSAPPESLSSNKWYNTDVGHAVVLTAATTATTYAVPKILDWLKERFSSGN